MKKQKPKPNTAEIAEIVKALIQQFADQKTKGNITVADFLRLMNVFRELEAMKDVEEVRVKWVGRDKAAR